MLPIAVALLLALVAVAAVAVAVRWWTWKPLERRRAVVQLDDGTAFEGVVKSRRGPLLELVDVTVRMPGGSQQIDGTVVVERTRVVFVQVMV